MTNNKSPARRSVLWSFALFAAGPPGYFFLLAVAPFDIAASYLVVAELLALVGGIVGWSERPGKVAVIGASAVMLWAGATYWQLFGPAGDAARERMEGETQALFEYRAGKNIFQQRETVLYHRIINVVVRPVLSRAEPHRGKWASHNRSPWASSSGRFFYLLFVLGAPGLVLAAPFAFALQAEMAGWMVGKGRRAAAAAGGVALFASFTALGEGLMTVGTDIAGILAGSAKMSAALLIPVSAVSVFGFWLPAVVTGLYTTLARRPKWWVAAPVGTATVIVGLWFCVIVGTFVGAATD